MSGSWEYVDVSLAQLSPILLSLLFLFFVAVVVVVVVSGHSVSIFVSPASSKMVSYRGRLIRDVLPNISVKSDRGVIE